MKHSYTRVATGLLQKRIRTGGEQWPWFDIEIKIQKGYCKDYVNIQHCYRKKYNLTGLHRYDGITQNATRRKAAEQLQKRFETLQLSYKT